MQKQRAALPIEAMQDKNLPTIDEARSNTMHPPIQVLPSVALSAPPTQQFYTVKEAAAILKISEDTLRRVMRRGQIAYVGISPRTRRISQKTLDRFAEQEVGVQHETSWQ